MTSIDQRASPRDHLSAERREEGFDALEIASRVWYLRWVDQDKPPRAAFGVRAPGYSPELLSSNPKQPPVSAPARSDCEGVFQHRTGTPIEFELAP